MPYLTAGIVAAAILWGELHWHRRYWFGATAAGWWLGRLGLEGLAGPAAVLLLRHVPKSVVPSNGVVLGVIAGIAAPRLLRAPAKLAGRNLNPLNLAYSRLIEPLDQKIDEYSAEAQRRYVRDVVRPSARAGDLKVADFADAFRGHLLARHDLSDADRTRGLTFVADIVDDQRASDDEKVGTLVLRSFQIGAYACCRDLLKDHPRPRRPLARYVTRFASRVP